jgi:tetratricopeptide (TPR) repeat protein
MNLTTYYNNRGWTYNQLQLYDRSVEDLNVAIRHDARYKNAYSNRADAYCSLKRYNEAIADFTTAIQV